VESTRNARDGASRTIWDVTESKPGYAADIVVCVKSTRGASRNPDRGGRRFRHIPLVMQQMRPLIAAEFRDIAAYLRLFVFGIVNA
jgi:hypothetical protein